jgi:hypothetical protein
MIPKSGDRFSLRQTRSVCAEIMRKTKGMARKSVQRFSDKAMRKTKEA